MAEIDCSKIIKEFDAIEEAADFAKKYLDSLLLTYVPTDVAEDIKNDARGHIIFDIYLKKVALHTNDIRNEIEKYVGTNLLSYLEWKEKQKTL